ncbi:sodium:calcium antiporter [Candidatus Mcinerneyibacteriota bacterium]|nr:sodium:calcium antiporter [Candidatus Mcinerneyibacteriota bacterium]
MLYLQFSLCALMIIFSGWFLSVYADIIAEKTKLGRGFIGLILLSAVTSLPELITSISAIVIRNAPDLSLGNILGSNMFNIFIIAFLEILIVRKPILYSISKENMTYIGFMILATMSAIMAMLGFDISVWDVSLFSMVIGGLYLAAMYTGYKNIEKENEDEAPRYVSSKLSSALLMFVLLGGVIVVTGSYATVLADKIALSTNLGRTFVGGLLLAAMTSLPEVITSVSSARLGAYDMIVGNILGSNLFNLGIIFIADLLYREGSVFADPKGNQIIPALFSIILVSLMIFGIMRKKPAKDRFKIHIETFFILGLYLLGLWLMYVRR